MVAALLSYEMPGIAEEIRRQGYGHTPVALVSREIAGVVRPEDIADTIWWVVSRPAHVNVSQVEVMPTTQSLASARVFKG